MSRIIYLIGAGASRGKRGDEKLEYADIRSGLPVVNEIPGRMQYVIRQLETYLSVYPPGELSVLPEIRNDLHWLAEKAQAHASIDTFAKKLFLTGQKEDYFRLKRALIVFLNYEQMFNPPDSRYDSFLASILQSDVNTFPEDISILSWNYDTQFELAYHEYCQDINSIKDLSKALKVYDKQSEKKDKLDGTYRLIKGFSIFKLNGSVSPGDDSFIEGTNVEKVESLCSMFKGMTEANCPLSFAWESTKGQFLQHIQDCVSEASCLVIIGYSFPFFNREIDRKIVGWMSRLRKIYIQDPNAETVKQSLRSALNWVQQDMQHVLDNVEFVTVNENQFFLPPEL